MLLASKNAASDKLFLSFPAASQKNLPPAASASLSAGADADLDKKTVSDYHKTS